MAVSLALLTDKDYSWSVCLKFGYPVVPFLLCKEQLLLFKADETTECTPHHLPSGGPVFLSCVEASHVLVSMLVAFRSRLHTSLKHLTIEGGPWESCHLPCGTHGQASKGISVSGLWPWLCWALPSWRPCPSIQEMFSMQWRHRTYLGILCLTL